MDGDRIRPGMSELSLGLRLIEKNEREKLFLFLKKLETKSNLGRKKETLNVFYLLKGQKVKEF